MNKKVLAIVGLVVGLIAILVVRSTLFGPSDRQLIDQAIQESIQASRDGRPGGVLEYLSQSFKLNDQDPGSRRNIAQFIKQSKPEVTLAAHEPVIEGDMASIVTDAQVNVDYLGMKMDGTLQGVRIVLQKEQGTKWLVFPDKQWRIVSVTAPQETVDQLLTR
ncbi:MAG TPA: hypothetical protein PLH94_02395 [Fimbriimonadaceae bacterium]|nr:hypothetical protein [Fimbriimonadaceae bacterium]